MADGTHYPEQQSDEIVRAVTLAMNQRTTFCVLRRNVCDAVRAKGGQVIATDRTDGTIIITYVTAGGQRQELTVVETHEYRTQVPVRDW